MGKWSKSKQTAIFFVVLATPTPTTTPAPTTPVKTTPPPTTQPPTTRRPTTRPATTGRPTTRLPTTRPDVTQPLPTTRTSMTGHSHTEPATEPVTPTLGNSKYSKLWLTFCFSHLDMKPISVCLRAYYVVNLTMTYGWSVSKHRGYWNILDWKKLFVSQLIVLTFKCVLGLVRQTFDSKSEIWAASLTVSNTRSKKATLIHVTSVVNLCSVRFSKERSTCGASSWQHTGTKGRWSANPSSKGECHAGGFANLFIIKISSLILQCQRIKNNGKFSMQI